MHAGRCYYLVVLSSSLQVKVTQELRNTHAEQMTRLHLKHQTECDLLEDMRYDGASGPTTPARRRLI